MAMNLAPTNMVNEMRKKEYRIPRPTNTPSVSPVPNRSDSLSWLALSETDNTGTYASGTNDIALTMSTTSNDRFSQTSRGLNRGQTILDGLEQSGLDQSEMRNQPEIKHKLIMGLTIPCLCAVVIFALNEVDSAQYKIMSLCVGICLHAFVVYWLYLIGTSSQLQRIRLITTRFDPFYGNMAFPTQIKHYPSRPIKSTSEMLALRGSSIHIFFNFMVMAISCVTANAVMLNWLDLRKHAHLPNQAMNINYLEQALVICSVFALPMVGYFELDVHSPCLMLMHYVGVLCLVLMAWPFAIQSGFSMASIAIIAMSYMSFAVWLYLGFYYPDDVLERENSEEMIDEEMRRRVHWMSLRCLLSQTAGTYGCIMALVLYLWNIEEVKQCQ